MFEKILTVFDVIPDLFVHEELEVIQAAGILAAGARAFPAAKRLEARPCTCGGALWSVSVSHARLNFIIELFDFFIIPVNTSRTCR